MAGPPSPHDRASHNHGNIATVPSLRVEIIFLTHKEEFYFPVKNSRRYTQNRHLPLAYTSLTLPNLEKKARWSRPAWRGSIPVYNCCIASGARSRRIDSPFALRTPELKAQHLPAFSFLVALEPSGSASPLKLALLERSPEFDHPVDQRRAPPSTLYQSLYLVS